MYHYINHWHFSLAWSLLLFASFLCLFVHMFTDAFPLFDCLLASSLPLLIYCHCLPPSFDWWHLSFDCLLICWYLSFFILKYIGTFPSFVCCCCLHFSFVFFMFTDTFPFLDCWHHLYVCLFVVTDWAFSLFICLSFCTYCLFVHLFTEVNFCLLSPFLYLFVVTVSTFPAFIYGSLLLTIGLLAPFH